MQAHPDAFLATAPLTESGSDLFDPAWRSVRDVASLLLEAVDTHVAGLTRIGPALSYGQNFRSIAPLMKFVPSLRWRPRGSRVSSSVWTPRSPSTAPSTRAKR